MTEIKNEVEGLPNEEVSLNHYCIARHDKNIVVANFHVHGRNMEKEVQFPLHYLYDKNWQSEYKDDLIKEKSKAMQLKESYNKNKDLDEIKRLKKLYPHQFKHIKS